MKDDSGDIPDDRHEEEACHDDVLDAIVKPRLKSQPAVLAAWNSVKRPIEPGGGAPAESGEPSAVPSVKVA